MKQLLHINTTLFAVIFMMSACGRNVDSAGEGATQPPHQSVQSSDAHSNDRGSHGEDELGDDGHGDDGHGDENMAVLNEQAAREAGIVVSQVETGPITQFISFPAEIRFDADRVANVSPKVSGVIARLYVGEGDMVKRGETLALISSRELAGLKAKWLKAQTELRLAGKTLEREERLFADEITAEADVQAARADFEAIKAEKDAAENELYAAGVSKAALNRLANADDGDNANSYLSAPIGGKIIRRGITLGETVSAGDSGSQTLFTIADDSVVWADIAIYKQDIGRIRSQAPVILKSDDGTILAQSDIAFVLPVINETSRTATARMILKNPEGNLRPGQFVTADISVGQSRPVLRVPLAAVQTVENKPSVFVPIEGGFKLRSVTLGAQSGGYVEIVSGLRLGDNFVSEGAFTLKAQIEKDAFGDDHGH